MIMKGKVVIAIFTFHICFFIRFVDVQSVTCGQLQNKIKSYEDEIKNLKISLEEYELVIGKTEDVSDECNDSLTCSTCLWEKRNPGCGWCVLRNRCSLSKNCPGNDFASDFWISGSDRCPKIRAVIPHHIPVSKAKMLQVIIPHLPAYDGPFICSFEVLSKTLVTKGQKSERGITCESPYTGSLPRFEAGRVRVKAILSVRTPNAPNFASTSNLTLYDCSRYQTCSECSASIYPCAWCIHGKRCTHDAYENCRNDLIVFSQSVIRPTIRQGPGFCPRISSFAESENEILVPSGSKKRIFVKVENIMLSHVQARFTCKVKGFPEVTGQLLGDTIYCNDINLVVLGRQPMYNLSFSVFWNGEGQLENPRKLHVVVYYCDRMADNCGECIDLPAQYNCGWCEENSSCSLREYCGDSVWMDENHTCKGPEIKSIYPTSGLLTARTNLTIEGINLAKEFKDIQSVTLVDEEGKAITDCTPHEYLHDRHSKISCLLGIPKILHRNNGSLRGFVEIKLSEDLVALSEMQYSFVDPVISGFQPVKGLESGGTVLKIAGHHLDAGSKVEVFIGDLPCQIIRSVSVRFHRGYLGGCGVQIELCVQSRSRYPAITELWRSSYIAAQQLPFGDLAIYSLRRTTSNPLSLAESRQAGTVQRFQSRDRSSIRCISSPVPANQPVPKSGAVRFLFDGEERRSSSYFFYVADPSIRFVKSEHGSEGPVGTPSGGSLIMVEGRNFDYAPNPYIYIIADGMEYPGTCTVITDTRMECLSPAIPADKLNFCEGEGFLPLHYGFKMGSVENVQNLSRNVDFGMYKLYPDPYLMPFSEEKNIKTFKSEYLIIEGNYLDTVLDESDFAVTVGGEECRITSLSHTQLICSVPDIQIDDYDENKFPDVQARICRGPEYFLGYLRREKD